MLVISKHEQLISKFFQKMNLTEHSTGDSKSPVEVN